MFRSPVEQRAGARWAAPRDARPEGPVLEASRSRPSQSRSARPCLRARPAEPPAGPATRPRAPTRTATSQPRSASATSPPAKVRRPGGKPGRAPRGPRLKRGAMDPAVLGTARAVPQGYEQEFHGFGGWELPEMGRRV